MPARHLQISRANTLYQHAETLLSNRQKRHRHGECLVEGVLPISRAVDYGQTVRAWWTCAGRPLSDWANEIMNSVPDADRIEVEPDLFEPLCQRSDGSELLATVATPTEQLNDLVLGAGFLGVLLDRPQNPGNVGSIVRTAVALGADAVIISGHAADPFDPKSVTASRGCVFTLPVVTIDSATQITTWRDQAEPGCRPLLVGASGTAATPLHSVDLRGPLLIALGNEAQGLAHGLREECDALVAIPMAGAATADSLNVAAAAAIVLYEISRQRDLSRAADRPV